MQLTAILDHPQGPLKVAPRINGAAPARSEGYVRLRLSDAKNYIDDVAVMFSSKLLTLRDELIGAVFMEDRILYCLRRREPIPGMDVVRNVPFAIELIRQGETSYVNALPVTTVRRNGNQLFYGLPYGDIELNYLFPVEGEHEQVASEAC